MKHQDLPFSVMILVEKVVVLHYISVKTVPRTNHVEALSVTVHIGNTPFNISSVYRQPTTDVISFMQLDNVLEDILLLNSNTIFLGDFNINFNGTNETRAHHIERNFQLKQMDSRNR